MSSLREMMCAQPLDYASRVTANDPIGSGMTWTERGSAAVLSLRTLSYPPERWSQFWSKVDQWGYPVAV